jgi:hypothetical protein
MESFGDVLILELILLRLISQAGTYYVQNSNVKGINYLFGFELIKFCELKWLGGVVV